MSPAPLRFPDGLGVYKGLRRRHLLLKELQQPLAQARCEASFFFFSFYKKRNSSPTTIPLSPPRHDVMSAPSGPRCPPLPAVPPRRRSPSCRALWPNKENWIVGSSQPAKGGMAAAVPDRPTAPRDLQHPNPTAPRVPQHSESRGTLNPAAPQLCLLPRHSMGQTQGGMGCPNRAGCQGWEGGGTPGQGARQGW